MRTVEQHRHGSVVGERDRGIGMTVAVEIADDELACRCIERVGVRFAETAVAMAR